MSQKKILIIGAASTVAQTLVKQLCQSEYDVLLISRENVSIEQCVSYQGNPCEEGSLPEIEGAIDGIVYFPGTLNLKPFGNLEIEDFRRDMEVNFFGAVNVIKTYEKNIRESEHGSIVLISSVAALIGMPFHTSISAAKSAIEGFSRSLAAEFAPKIRVNCIAPTITKTKLTEKLVGTDDKAQEFAKRHPMHSINTPEDLGQMIEFLLSEKSAMITAQILRVDGGYSTISKAN